MQSGLSVRPIGLTRRRSGLSTSGGALIARQGLSMRISLIGPETDPPPGAWEDLMSVLRGTQRPPLDARALKLLKLITAAPIDVRVRPGCLETWPERGGRNQYVSELAAPVLYHLMRRLGLSRIDDARVGLIERAGLGASFGAARLRALWIVPGPDAVMILLRDAPRRRGPRVAVPVPETGPWALPIAYAHPEADWVAATRACPHCKTRPSVFRRLDRAFVCPECGRSFEALAGAGFDGSGALPQAGAR
jgi:rubredoxin